MVVSRSASDFLYKLVSTIVVLVPFLLCPITTHASVNIPLDSAFYDDIDLLGAQGLIQSDLSSTRPIARTEAGRLLAEAEYFSEIEEIPSVTTRLLTRMAEDFDEEISVATAQASAPGTALKPLDELSIAYTNLDGPFSIFNNEGIDYFNGNNATLRFQTEARLWRVFSFYIEPLFLYNENVRGVEGDDDSTFRLHKGYIKFTVDNFEIQWGKDTLWWGPGYHGALLISNNARPFELYKVSNPRATLLPWIFTFLGPFRYNLFIAELDKEPASGHPPNSKLFGARVDFKPHPVFEFGMSYLTHFGGDRPGVAGLDLSDYYHIIVSNECRSFDKRDSNKQAAIDAALTIPGISDFVPIMDSLKVYAEWGGEDQSITPDKRAYLLGMVFENVVTVHGLNLRVEYAHLSPGSVPGAWYSHAVWPMTHYGRIFGHHAGTDSDDLFLELSHKFRDRFFYSISFDRERSGLHRAYIQEKQQYFIEAGLKIKKWLNLMLRYGQEQISNAGNVKGAEEENRLIAAELAFTF
ncbi:MAG: hypothetical protein JRF35_13305 [Deltaproteobacteria bacterium]|nr:hypothetical protein [Deltaproteobacteria bacterium]